MRYISIPGIERPISRIALGTAAYKLEEYDHDAQLLDTFLAKGGTCIDTAKIYGGGASEKTLGRWFAERNNRENVVLISKGCHPVRGSGPRVAPEIIHADLHESLERLGTDIIDIYMLHRDDETVPVGPLVEALNAEHLAGHIRVFGGSNWRTERIAEANAYAAAHGLIGFNVSSPNLSLARPKEPMWVGCISASDSDRAWHRETQTPLISWSSQAGGFLSGRFTPDDTSNADMLRVWYSDDNFERLNRAIALGKQRGVGPIPIALAYLLNQPFPTIALVGSASIAELEESLLASDIELSADDLAYLDLQA